MPKTCPTGLTRGGPSAIDLGLTGCIVGRSGAGGSGAVSDEDEANSILGQAFPCFIIFSKPCSVYIGILCDHSPLRSFDVFMLRYFSSAVVIVESKLLCNVCSQHRVRFVALALLAFCLLTIE